MWGTIMQQLLLIFVGIFLVQFILPMQKLQEPTKDETQQVKNICLANLMCEICSGRYIVAIDSNAIPAITTCTFCEHVNGFNLGSARQGWTDFRFI
jgi:hypothetical protein